MTKIRIVGYLHSSKDTMQELGETAGLTGEALANFRYSLYEVAIPMMVDTETGEYEILRAEIKE